jgi:hypothetical protein
MFRINQKVMLCEIVPESSARYLREVRLKRSGFGEQGSISAETQPASERFGPMRRLYVREAFGQP